MKKYPDKKLIEEVSLETGIHPAFIEKDWHAVQLIELVNQYSKQNLIALPIFSGGTCLSKGYGLIQRFSEDLDFILKPDSQVSYGQRRSYRRGLVNLIEHHREFSVNGENILRGDSHRFFKAPIKYKKCFDQDALRPFLQLEMTFSSPRLPTQKRSIKSIISNIIGGPSETEIHCISPLETAGDKLSALTWRLLIRNRNSEKDDPSLIRHLHDLAALAKMIDENKTIFIQSAHHALNLDQNRRGGDVIKNLSIKNRLDEALNLLKEDKMYSKEYERFVMSMSYADDDDRISFEQAHVVLEKLINLYISEGAT